MGLREILKLPQPGARKVRILDGRIERLRRGSAAQDDAQPRGDDEAVDGRPAPSEETPTNSTTHDITAQYDVFPSLPPTVGGASSRPVVLHTRDTSDVSLHVVAQQLTHPRAPDMALAPASACCATQGARSTERTSRRRCRRCRAGRRWPWAQARGRTGGRCSRVLVRATRRRGAR